MDTREKLIELIEQVYFCSIEELADHLIANGITFATDNNVGHKWIPVTERLPEKMKDVLVIRMYGEPDIEFRFGDGTWMPLPEPPKEDA